MDRDEPSASYGRFETRMMFRYLFPTLCTALLIVGCDAGKSGPTDAELDRIALTHKIELAEAEGGLALVVGGESITSDEIIGSQTELFGMPAIPKDYFGPLAQSNDLGKFKSLARAQFEEVVLGRISNILLVQHAKRKAGPNVDEALNRAAESELRRFVLGFAGNEAKADEELRKLGLDRKSYKERRKDSLLIDWYLGVELADTRPVTYREMVDTYNKMKEDGYFARDAGITFRLIDIEPARIQAPDPTQDTGQLARELADKLVERIRSGEDFAELAKQYSHGHRRTFGGLWPPLLQPQALAAPYNVLAAEVDKIEPGEIAGPIVTAGHIFIIKLEEKRVAAFEDADVQRRVERKVLVDRQNSARGRLIVKLREEARLGKVDEFVDFCLDKIHSMSRQPQSETTGQAKKE